MKRTSLTHHINAFKSEILMLLRFQFAFNRITKFSDIQKISRSDFVDKLISLKAIENDILIRVCKFDDNTKGVHSFTKALTEIPNTHPNKIEIKSKIKQFSKLIGPIKQKRRHQQLAHLKIGMEDNDYNIRYNFIPVIQLAVEIVDLMSEVKITYNWSDGRDEKVDLYQEVLSEQPPVASEALDGL